MRNTDMNRRCVSCGQIARLSDWLGNTGDICPHCHSAGDKSREQIELELISAIEDLISAIEKLTIVFGQLTQKADDPS
jgi:Zn finger protein HypA/HybF involved in hydrogenase expression